MPVEDDDGWGGGDETDGWGTASAAKSAQKNPSLDAMQSGDSWRFVAPTTAQLRVGKLLVDQIADQISHRETKTITAEKSEIHAALCYANTQICGEAHSTFFQGCDCGCCESYWQEAFSTCQSCRQHEIIRDRILESKGDPPPAVILTAEGLDRAFPQQFRPDWHKKVAKAKGSRFNFSFDK